MSFSIDSKEVPCIAMKDQKSPFLKVSPKKSFLNASFCQIIKKVSYLVCIDSRDQKHSFQKISGPTKSAFERISGPEKSFFKKLFDQKI
jgi:hypothetical protein